MSQLLVGAGGWAYFQVPGVSSIKAYARAFDFVEVNSSYYELPTMSAASEWRKRVPDKFVFSVRSPRVLVDRYGLKVQSDSRELIRETVQICSELDAVVLTVLVNFSSPVKENDVPGRVRNFLEAVDADDTVVALEFRNIKPSEDVIDTMKELGAVHAVDLSTSEPSYSSKLLYSRLFGKGEGNIYEFDDKELRDVAQKASQPKFEKSIMAFHGVRMYRDAGRVKSFIQKGFFPKITSGVGIDSIREVLSEDARFPTSKSALLKDQGWKVFQGVNEVRKISSVLEKLPEERFSSLDDLMGDLRSHRDLFSP